MSNPSTPSRSGASRIARQKTSGVGRQGALGEPRQLRAPPLLVGPLRQHALERDRDAITGALAYEAPLAHVRECASTQSQACSSGELDQRRAHRVLARHPLPRQRDHPRFVAHLDAIQRSTSRSSTVSGTAPLASRVSWNARRSKRPSSDPLRARSEGADLELADLVPERLPGPRDVAIDLCLDVVGAQRGVLGHEGDRARPGPAQRVQACVRPPPARPATSRRSSGRSSGTGRGRSPPPAPAARRTGPTPRRTRQSSRVFGSPAHRPAPGPARSVDGAPAPPRAVTEPRSRTAGVTSDRAC